MSSWNETTKKWMLGILLVAGLAAARSVHAEAVLAPMPKPERLAPGEDYAESRFGAPPARIIMGQVHRPNAASEVRDIEAPDEELAPSRANRAPAGLVFSARESDDDAGNSRSREIASAASTIKETVSEAPAVNPALNPAIAAEKQEFPQTATAAARKGVQEVSVIAGDLGFFPKTLFVSRDVPVRMFVTSASKSTLCIMMDSFQVRRQLRTTKIEEITFTPNVPGKYRFYCPVNGMEGTLIVKEFAAQFTQN